MHLGASFGQEDCYISFPTFADKFLGLPVSNTVQCSSLYNNFILLPLTFLVGASLPQFPCKATKGNIQSWSWQVLGSTNTSSFETWAIILLSKQQYNHCQTICAPHKICAPAQNTSNFFNLQSTAQTMNSTLQHTDIQFSSFSQMLPGKLLRTGE